MMVLNRDNILKAFKKHQADIRRLGVKKIGIFGSYVNNSQTKKSDIDILVEFHRGEKTFDRYMDLKDLLENLLSREVDLVTKEALKSRIKSSILRQTRYAGLYTFIILELIRI